MDDYNEILAHFNDRLEFLGMEKSTRRMYTTQARKFLNLIQKPVKELNEDDVVRYMEHLHKQNNNLNPKTINNYVDGLKSFFGVELGHPLNEYRVPRLLTYEYLPNVLTHESIRRLLDCTESIKYKSMISLAYGSGLRVSEILRVRIQDIDSKKMQLTIPINKNRREHTTVLSRDSLNWMREYYKSCKPYYPKREEIFFRGERSDGTLSPEALRKAFKAALKTANINVPGTRLHDLRHSFAIDMLIKGYLEIDVMNMLGEKLITSMSPYMRMTTVPRKNIISPLDFD